MSELKERAAFTLSQSVKSELEASVPKTKRSQFVNEAIASALLSEAKKKALRALDNLPLVENKTGKDSVEVLREIRAERMRQLIERHAVSAA